LLSDGQIDYFFELEDLKQHAAHLVLNKKPKDKSRYPQLINWTESGHGAKCVLARPDDHVISKLEQELDTPVKLNPMSLEDWYLEVTNETNA
jgi:hypothetical protein